MSDKKKSCYLGALAPELLDKIFLEIDSVHTLDNFIVSSRFIHEHFEKRKEAIIFYILQNELGPVFTDARLLYRFPYTEPSGDPESSESWKMHWDRIHTAAAMYRNMLATGCDKSTDALPNLAELTELCRTYHQMNFLTSTYIAAQQRSFGSGPAAVRPSHTERLRVLRAFYRRQILSNAWAPANREPRVEDLAAISNTSDHQGVRLGLFAAFEIWELQQVDHVDHFIRRLCSRLAGQPVSAEAQIPVLFSHTNRLVPYMRKHRDLSEAALLSLSHINSPHEERKFVKLPCPIYFLAGWQAQRFRYFPDPERDQRQERGDSIDFSSDGVELPPFGWVDALDGRYVEWFGPALVCIPGMNIPNERERLVSNTSFLWRSTGFALWDRKRVEAMKELDELKVLRTGWAVC
ncbi:hypothetical protein F5884DRAFT_788493 [Xylogone sp. PMI_703]|nr:hypothetical protein F5884DRAFT_788493 [Xylogone sp. PMI_703]